MGVSRRARRRVPAVGQVAAAARNMGLVLGIVERALTDDGKVYYNSAISIGEQVGVYRKHHLVPLGEFRCSRCCALAAGVHAHPDVGFQQRAGPPAPLVAAGHSSRSRSAMKIRSARKLFARCRRRALLVNLSEDAWFGDSLAPHQHYWRLRACARVETGRSPLRATNTGITAIIDPRGRIVARTKHLKAEVLTGTVQLDG